MRTNIKYIFFAIAFAALGFVACERLDNVSDIKDVDLLSTTIKLTLPEDTPDGVPLPSTLNISITNFKERYTREFEVEVDASLSISIDSLIPGFYSIIISAEATGWRYTGSAVNVPIVNKTTELNVEVVLAQAGRLVIKEIFYAGRTLPQGGTYFREQFVEIYNNSDEVIYLDSVGFAVINPLNAAPVLPAWPEADGSRYVYADNAVWQIPGSGTCFPLQPGESVIIAQRAIDHTVFMPGSVFDLRGAEFETYIVNAALPPSQAFVRIPPTVYRTSPAMQFLAPLFGPAYVIFRQDGPLDRNFTSRAAGTTTDHFKIRRSDVLDAVEAIGNMGLITEKRMPVELDAGAVTVEGLNVGRGAARRVRSWRPDGTPILYDTNNSTHDFEVVDPPQIRRHGARRPAWNTSVN